MQHSNLKILIAQNMNKELLHNREREQLLKRELYKAPTESSQEKKLSEQYRYEISKLSSNQRKIYNIYLQEWQISKF